MYILLRKAIVLVMSHEFLRIFYPNTYYSIAFTMTYNTIYLFSKAQILFKTTILPLLQKNTNSRSSEIIEPTNLIEFIQDGNIIHRCLKENLYPQTYDFVIENRNNDRIIIQQIGSEMCTEDYKVSKVKFILVEIIISEDVIFSVSFTTDQYNYAIANNRITSNFIKYFVQKHYLYIPDSNLILLGKYSMKIIDDNINIVTLTNNDTLVFLEDSYIIENVSLSSLPPTLVDAYSRNVTSSISWKENANINNSDNNNNSDEEGKSENENENENVNESESDSDDDDNDVINDYNECFYYINA